MNIQILKKLLELNRKITGLLDIESLLANIMDAAIELTGAERGFIMFADEKKKNKFSFKAARNLDKEDIEKASFKISSSIAEKVFKTGVPLLTTDAQEDPRFKASVSVQGLKLRSIIAVPLTLGKTTIGVVYLDNRFQKGIFSEDEINILSAFADQAAIAIENARLYSENLKKQNELLHKNEEIQNLNDKLASLIAKQSIELENISSTLVQKQRDLEFKYDYHNIVGKSPAMQGMFQMLDRVIDTETTVLITGASGTGKELVAHAIHYNGPRKKGSFLSINCAALPETLLESELFGHKRGAFTGATGDHIGLFEKADKGTLFLDEIGEMPFNMQAKLLRVVQNGRVRKVGSTEEIQVDVRIIAATNKNLSNEVENKMFREDLYYRLNVLPINLPSLKERKEDLPLLIERFIKNSNFKKEGMRVSPQAMNLLLEHSWPGNVRELQNVIERALVLSDGQIEPQHLPKEIVDAANKMTTGVVKIGNLRNVRNDLERNIIIQTLSEVGGNKSNAAEKLGLSRYGLYKKLKRFGLA